MKLRLQSDLDLRHDPSRRYLPWIIAFMVFMAALAVAAAMVVTSSLGEWSRGLVGTLTVQVPTEAGTADADARVERVLEAVRGTPGIARARAFSAEESRALLDPWLGSAAPGDRLPLPRLIDVRVRDGTRIDAPALETSLAALVPGTVVDDHGAWLRDLAATSHSVRMATATVVAIIALAAVLTVVYATRSAFAVHRPTIEVLHLIGAHDGYVARQFEIQAAMLGLIGGAIGLVAATLVLLAFEALAPAVTATLLPDLALGTGHWLVLSAFPVLAAAITTLTARVTVLRALQQMA